MGEKLPLEILKEKYLPVTDYPEKYGISVAKIMSLISSRKLRYAEFKVPGQTRRSPHVNYEDVLRLIKEEQDESDSSIRPESE